MDVEIQNSKNATTRSDIFGPVEAVTRVYDVRSPPLNEVDFFEMLGEGILDITLRP